MFDFFGSRLLLTMLFDGKSFVSIFKRSTNTNLINIFYLDQGGFFFQDLGTSNLHIDQLRWL